MARRLIAVCLLIAIAPAGLWARPPQPALITVAAFDFDNGLGPFGLVSDAAGNMYGVTGTGGASDGGTLFRVDGVTGELTAIHHFDYFNDGSNPISPPTIDAFGNIYGTTPRSGPGNRGVVFRLDAAGQFSVLRSFDPINGYTLPSGKLALDGAGNLYGTTSTGPGLPGVPHWGTLYRLDASGGPMTTLLVFDGVEGRHPSGGLVTGADGSLFGIAGAKIFRFDPASGVLTTLASLGGPHGNEPSSGLVTDSAGNLYGVTRRGGAFDHGTIYRVDPAANSITTLASFTGLNGSHPEGDVVVDAAGNVFGVTYHGGEHNLGVVYRLNSATGLLSSLVSFSGPNGRNPVGPLVAGADGNLFGTANIGGPMGFGTVFKITNSGLVVPEPPAAWLVASALGAVGALRAWTQNGERLSGGVARRRGL